ncbi:MAG: RagB/SusD family nutrient uptake outer membrane protein [Tannerella sp.]|nr:RagB/SusD family nutrient uptake outer membrane protein [Tannerella sp.]
MKTNRIKYICRYLAWIPCMFIFSCNYLDVVPDNTPTIDDGFKNRYEAEGFLYGCFSALPSFADPGVNPALLGGDEVWVIDPVDYISPRLWYIARGDQGTVAPLANYWSSQQSGNTNGGTAMFTALSDCNMFFENIHKPYDLDDAERDRWVAEVKFIKAFYHFWLLRMYGPIPVIDENRSISAKGEDARIYREPVDEVVEYIVSLLDEATVNLPDVIEDPLREMGRPTRAIALALKAQTLTLAASPLFNGTATEPPSFSLVDNRGIELFPQTYDANKWQRAAEALKEAIDEAHGAGHRLYDFVRTNPAYVGFNEKTILSMQVRGAVTERWNEEIIWGDSRSNPSALQNSCIPAFYTVHNNGSAGKSYAPTLQAVEQFYTKNGLPIEDDQDWVGVDPYAIRTATAEDKYYVQQNYQTIQLHFDREARFYGSILFDGGSYYGNNRINTDDNLWYIPLRAGTIAGGTSPSNRHSSTGYLCKKLLHFRSSMPDNAASYSNERYSFPIIRLADLYLMYAEALNEAGGDAPQADVYNYVNLVRTRSGLKGVVETWNDHAVASQRDRPLSKTGMREIIRRERLNELAFEGARFWDLKRWKLSMEYMNRPVRGWDITGETPADFYKMTEIYPLTYETKDYFWPIRQSTLLRNKNMEQNPGW